MPPVHDALARMGRAKAAMQADAWPHGAHVCGELLEAMEGAATHAGGS